MTNIQIPARELQVNDHINGARVTAVDLGQWGTVAVRINGHPGPRADMIFGHGDPVRIVRTDSYASSGCHCGDDVHDCR